MKILVVDDEKLLVKGIKFNLENEGYQVLTAYDGATAVELARQETLDLIILDLMMPGLSGSEACMKIREFSDVPIIMLTARSEDADKIMGFACGADDYVTKPFNILELKARIRALLRRSSGQSRPAAQPDPELLTVGDLTLDTRQRVAIRDGKAIDLTAKEYDLVELLMKNPRRVYSRESLMDLVWGYSYAGDYRTVDVHIRRLREKLERVPAEPASAGGLGILNAGKEKNFLTIFFDGNLNADAPQTNIASAIRDFPACAQEAIQDVIDGKFTAGAIEKGLAENSLYLDFDGSAYQIPADVMEKYNAAVAAIKDGTIVVPSTIEEAKVWKAA